MSEELPTLRELKATPTQPASALSPEAQINPLICHGGRLPEWNLTEEKPWHKYAAYMFSTGLSSVKQVAQYCEVNERTVMNLLRQRWFQERVTCLIADNGGRDIMKLLRAEQFNTMIVMIEMRDDKKCPSAVRAGICRDILDRTLGKPIQRIETEDKTHSDDPVAEARRLKEELARSRERSEE